MSQPQPHPVDAPTTAPGAPWEDGPNPVSTPLLVALQAQEPSLDPSRYCGAVTPRVFDGLAGEMDSLLHSAGVSAWPRLAHSPVCARTPHAVVSRLNKEIVRAIQAPDVQARFTGQGLAPAFSTGPWLRQLRDDAAALLRRPVHMTGSGSTLFTLCGSAGEAGKMSEKIISVLAGRAETVVASVHMV